MSMFIFLPISLVARQHDDEKLSLTSSSVADDLVGPTTALVRSALGWVLVLRMPGNQEVKPPLDAEVAGFLSAGGLPPKDVFTLASLSGR